MTYSYTTEMRQQVFNPTGQEMLAKVRKFLPEKRCTIMSMYNNTLGDLWTLLACIDYLEEIGELRILRDPNKATQDWMIEKTNVDPIARARDPAFKGME